MHTGEFAVVTQAGHGRRAAAAGAIVVDDPFHDRCRMRCGLGGQRLRFARRRSFRELAEKYLGRYELVVLPVGPEDSPLPPLSKDLIGLLRQDPAVAAVDPVFQTRVKIKAKAAPTAGSGRRETAPPATLPRPRQMPRRLSARMPPSRRIHCCKGSGSIPGSPALRSGHQQGFGRTDGASKLATT